MKKKSNPDPVKAFLELAEAEKTVELAPFERGEIPLSQSRPLNAAERSCGPGSGGDCGAGGLLSVPEQR